MNAPCPFDMQGSMIPNCETYCCVYELLCETGLMMCESGLIVVVSFAYRAIAAK